MVARGEDDAGDIDPLHCMGGREGGRRHVSYMCMSMHAHVTISQSMSMSCKPVYDILACTQTVS